LYTGGMTLTSSATVNAEAFKSGYNPSAMASASFSGSPTTGNVFYVATNGSDSNSCAQARSTSTPKRNIMGANGGLACLVAGNGDTLDIRAGTYQESLTTNTQTWPSGTSYTNAATIKAHTGEAVSIRQIALASPAAYIIFDSLVVDGSLCVGCFNDLIWVGSGGHHVRFLNMESKNGVGQAAAVDPNGSFVEFIGGSYHDQTGNVLCGYCFYISGKDNLVDRVKCYNGHGYGIQIYSVYGPGLLPDRNIVRNSEFYNIQPGSSAGNGILLGSGDSNQAYNNIVRNNAGTGIGSGYGATNAKIYNNTIVSNGGYGTGVGGDTNTIIKNNIIYNNSLGAFNVFSPATYTITNNLCGSSGTGCAVVGNPLFVNPTGNNYAVNQGSPAIDNGTILTDVPPYDINGNLRPQGAGWDIGAYER
jgi:hypothetical protein